MFNHRCNRVKVILNSISAKVYDVPPFDDERKYGNLAWESCRKFSSLLVFCYLVFLFRISVQFAQTRCKFGIFACQDLFSQTRDWRLSVSCRALSLISICLLEWCAFAICYLVPCIWFDPIHFCHPTGMSWYSCDTCDQLPSRNRWHSSAASRCVWYAAEVNGILSISGFVVQI